MNKWKACQGLPCSLPAPCGLVARYFLPWSQEGPRYRARGSFKCVCVHVHIYTYVYTHTHGGGDPKHKTSCRSPKHHLGSFSFYPFLTCKQSTHPLGNVAGEHAVSEVSQASDCLLVLCVFSDTRLKRIDRKTLPAADWVDRSLSYCLENGFLSNAYILEIFPILTILEMQTDSCFQKALFFLLMTVKKPQGGSRLVTLDERGCSRTRWKPEALCFRLRSERGRSAIEPP